MRNRYKISAVVFLLGCSGILASIGWAGGYLAITNTGVAFRWDPSQPVSYNPDKGTLGKLSNSEAVDLLANNINVWDTNHIPTCALSFENGGSLPIDVNSVETYNMFAGKDDNLNPMIFDTDGSLFEALGFAKGVIGTAGPEFITTTAPFRIVAGIGLFNGAFINGDASDGVEISVANFGGVIAHEFGHLLNLDHTSVNGQFFLGDDQEPGFTAYGSPPVSSVNLMFPILISGQPSTPQFDDRIWISNLYPVAPFPTNKGSISGSVFLNDGTTLFQGANVIARNPSSPFLNAASNVSGALYDSTASFPDGGHPDAALQGAYEIPGLTANANYTVEVTAVNPTFTGGSRVGPVDPPAELPGPEEFYNGNDESSDPNIDMPLTATDVTAVVGVGATNIDIVLNETPTGVNEPSPNVPHQYALQQNFPNPFNPVTTIRYTIASGHSDERVRLEIYNLLGQKIRTLVDTPQGAGEFEATWNGTNDQGLEVASGVYVYRLQTGDFLQSRKLILLR